MGALGLGAPACSKAPPPDVHLGEAARLVQSDPQRALAEIDQARDPGSGSAELLRGLAYEGLQDYARAEQSLEKARGQPRRSGVCGSRSCESG
jgi:tetratricopeptide (TPR) repeat protein